MNICQHDPSLLHKSCDPTHPKCKGSPQPDSSALDSIHLHALECVNKHVSQQYFLTEWLARERAFMFKKAHKITDYNNHGQKRRP